MYETTRKINCLSRVKNGISRKISQPDFKFAFTCKIFNYNFKWNKRKLKCL